MRRLIVRLAYFILRLDFKSAYETYAIRELGLLKVLPVCVKLIEKTNSHGKSCSF